MEEKKALNDEKIEEVSGGRRLFAEQFAALDPAKKEELAKRWPNFAASLANKEIPREFLDAVSGGEMTEEYASYLDYFIGLCKQSGYTLDYALYQMRECGAFSEEDINYVASHW
ncbi:MAG: hypothetical protein K6C08_13215 [Oscillospiraceae bacterium]|nr:hypothetical protein [Oscillospiraceae bacterium]